MSTPIRTTDALIDSYVLAGDTEMILVVEQMRHLKTGGKLGARAFLSADQARTLAGCLIEHAERIERASNARGAARNAGQGGQP